MRRLYERYAHPLARIVQGVPTSWDPVIATTKWPRPIWRTVWSPCGRFIAISGSDITKGIQVLDAVTLNRLKSFARQERSTQLFTISTGGRLLTWLGRQSGAFISWDLQTGVPVSEIPIGEGRFAREASSITYSGCGTMFGVLFKGGDATTIGTYDAFSGTAIHCHSVEGSAVDVIWTHGKCVQFGIFGSQSITIWEVGFVLEHPATVVVSLPTPDNFDSSREFAFLPAQSLLGFVLEKTVIVWDAQHSKFLLNSVDVGEPRKLTFSPDGCFFACGTDGPEIHLWKKTPSGYIPHRTLLSSAGCRSKPCEPLLSPCGQSIVVSDGSILRLWRTTDSPIPNSSPPIQTLRRLKRFILGFTPNESLAAVVRSTDDTVTVLNLKSGVPRLVIDAGMKIHGLRVAEDSIVIVGDGRIVTWALPAGDNSPNARVGVNGSIRETAFEHLASIEFPPAPFASISPYFNQVAVADPAIGLHIYDVSTGKHLAGAKSRGTMSWFTLEGYEVWCCSATGIGEGWGIDKYGGSNATKLEPLDPTGGPSGGFPWQSPRGYKVTDDGWVLSSGGKRLLWLPPHWRSGETDRVWGGRILALLHPELPEVVVLELLQE